jgi:hypothetical protein
VSIFATTLTIEDERQWIASLEADGIGAGVIRDGNPDPDDLDAPIIYQGSHVLPADSSPRAGSVELALIPSHITRDGRDDRPEDEKPWAWLRLSVGAHASTYGGGGDATVLLTVRQATRLRDSISEWLAEVTS